MKEQKEGINSPFYLGDFAPWYLKERKPNLNIFFKKTGIDPVKFSSPNYLVGLGSEEQYHSFRKYFELSEISFLVIVLEYDMKGCFRHSAMEQRFQMLKKLLANHGILEVG